MVKNPLAGRRFKGFSSSGDSYSPSGQLWPNGEFSFGYKRILGDERLDMRHPADNPEGIAPKGDGGVPPLDLVNASNSHTDRTPRGINGITTYGRRMLRSACYQVARDYPRNRPVFATLTLPPLPRDRRQLISKRWGEVVRQTIQYVSRALVKAGLPPVVLSCSEYQPDRMTKTGGDAYLHLHMVWINPVRFNTWSIDVQALAIWFTRLISRLAEYPLDVSCNIDTKLARGNIAYEMAKYLSKGSTVLSGAEKDLGMENLPATYWNMSAVTRDKIKAELLKGQPVGEVLENLIAYGFHAHEINDLFLWVRHIDCDLGGTLVTVGYTGLLTASVHLDVRDWTRV